MNTSKVKALACANRFRQRVILWIFYFLAGRRRVKMYVYRERGLQQCSGGTVATRWRGFSLHSHSCSPARSSGEILRCRRDKHKVNSKTHLPSHVVHFFLSSLVASLRPVTLYVQDMIQIEPLQCIGTDVLYAAPVKQASDEDQLFCSVVVVYLP